MIFLHGHERKKQRWIEILSDLPTVTRGPTKSLRVSLVRLESRNLNVAGVSTHRPETRSISIFYPVSRVWINYLSPYLLRQFWDLFPRQAKGEERKTGIYTVLAWIQQLDYKFWCKTRKTLFWAFANWKLEDMESRDKIKKNIFCVSKKKENIFWTVENCLAYLSHISVVTISRSRGTHKKPRAGQHRRMPSRSRRQKTLYFYTI